MAKKYIGIDILMTVIRHLNSNILMLLFDKNIFERYDVMKTYNMKIEVTFYNNKKRLRIL